MVRSIVGFPNVHDFGKTCNKYSMGRNLGIKPTKTLKIRENPHKTCEKLAPLNYLMLGGLDKVGSLDMEF